MHRLPRDSLQHITRLGDSREVDLGLDLARQGTSRRLGGTGSVLRGIRLYAEVLTHFHCLIRLNGAGMRLLLNDADLRQEVEDFLALDFQFPCQIVDANLIHPVLRPLEFPCSPAAFGQAILTVIGLHLSLVQTVSIAVSS